MTSTGMSDIIQSAKAIGDYHDQRLASQTIAFTVAIVMVFMAIASVVFAILWYTGVFQSPTTIAVVLGVPMLALLMFVGGYMLSLRSKR